jgi:type III secretion protein U
MSFEEALNTLLTEMFRESVRLLLPYLLIVIVLGLFVEMAQTGMLLALKSLIPSGKKLNVITNVKNVFSKKNLVEFLKSNIKIVALSAIVYSILKAELGTLITLPLAGLAGVGVAFAMLLKSLMVQVAVGYVVIALADFAWQRKNHVKQLMMSKDEVKQEYKQAEGDPHIKHERKHLHQEMLEEGGAVHKTRDASVVVTNPTHLAIALRYVQAQTPLPIVLAKGEGALAERMVAAARAQGIPVLQNIPLARALMKNASVNQYIPTELIEPVAQVLLLVQELGSNEE